jgi:hypothetical protein
MVAALFLRAARDGKKTFLENKKYFQIGNQVYFPTQFESCQSELNSIKEKFSKTNTSALSWCNKTYYFGKVMMFPLSKVLLF